MRSMDFRRSSRPGSLTRRALLGAAAGSLLLPRGATAQTSFDNFVASFRTRALARGVSAETYARVMNGLKPDNTVFAEFRAQPEFTESLWQYVYRRASDFRIITGREKARAYAALLDRIERDYGVERHLMLALWGMESSFGDVIDNPKYMRQVIPALAALAHGEPRRRAYWQQELANALLIVERGWAAPQAMVGSWAGAMGHTQWMPEVWLNIGVDYDKDGRIFPFGPPDDAFAGSARYFIARGGYRRGEPWGYEVRLPPTFNTARADNKTMRSVEAWQAAGVTRADKAPFDQPGIRMKLWLPAAGGPAFLLGQNFLAVRSYNPSSSYALATVHLADRIRADGGFIQPFPGAEERIPTLAEVQEMQRRLTALGFDTDGTDGRVGRDTMRAILGFQRKVGMQPADGYAGLKLLARLRQAG